jgi:cysteine-S-conjugate beta-lyase
MDFDQLIERRNTASTKWNKYAGKDILPMWVADMDFASPPSVLAALHQRIDHGVFGYTDPPSGLIDAVRAYALEHYGWPIEPEWLVWLPGLVPGLNLACRAVGQPGDAVLTATPVYPPFLRAPGFSQRELIAVPLVQRTAGWGWDFGALEAAIVPGTRLILLCHPHNPVGRVWRENELSQLIGIAKRHDLIVCSDEIHCDLILDPGLRHIPLACIEPEFGHRTITLLAPSKTWNLAGLGCSLAVIPDPLLRRQFCREMAGLLPSVNLLGYTAAEAAYRDDSGWRDDLLEYLRGNRELLRVWFGDSPHLKLTVPEATYLAWIDARGIDRNNPLPFFEALGVGLSDGRDFGFPGYLRLNFGCRRELLQEALRRLIPLRDHERT